MVRWGFPQGTTYRSPASLFPTKFIGIALGDVLDRPRAHYLSIGGLLSEADPFYVGIQYTLARMARGAEQHFARVSHLYFP